MGQPLKNKNKIQTKASKQTQAPATKTAKNSTVDEILVKLQPYNLKRSDAETAAKYYYNQPDLQKLNPDQLTNLLKRLVARAEAEASPSETTKVEAPVVTQTNLELKPTAPEPLPTPTEQTTPTAEVTPAEVPPVPVVEAPVVAEAQEEKPAQESTETNAPVALETTNPPQETKEPTPIETTSSTEETNMLATEQTTAVEETPVAEVEAPVELAPQEAIQPTAENTELVAQLEAELSPQIEEAQATAEVTPEIPAAEPAPVVTEVAVVAPEPPKELAAPVVEVAPTEVTPAPTPVVAEAPVVVETPEAEPEKEPVKEAPVEIMEPRYWRKNGWSAKVIKNEDDDGWAVEISKDGLPDPVLVSPWVMGRDKKNPKPFDGPSFTTFVKTASEVMRRAAQQRERELKKSTNSCWDGTWYKIVLEIIPDEFDPHAFLSATNDAGEVIAKIRVQPNYKFSQANIDKWVRGGFKE